jgi:alpha-galactosidase
VELGLDDDHLRLTLPAGQSLDLPDVLFQPVPNGDPALAAPAFHRYVSTRLLPAARPDVPVIYNTWFDVHEWFTVDRLRRQLAAARQIGCEVFVIDAGWYGAGVGQWHEQVGDWREKLDGAFHGRMADFAAEVRATGLGFGLWMEPERLAAGVPIVRERPQWFLSSDGKHYWPNLDDPDAYAYLLGEMSRLVTTYKLAWMKVDFNFERGVDPSGSEFAWYYRAWYRLMDELRARHPSVVFEGCASGGLRFDLSTLSHFDGHFLSDTVTPLDVLRIYQGMMLRLPPGRTTKWAVLGASKRDAAGLPVADARAPTIMAPVGANWRQSTPTTVDFAARVALSGIFGVSGDIASLAKPALDRLAYHVAFFKKWRNFIVTSVGHLLTPPCPIDDGRGWAAVQLQGAQDTTSLLFVYRLNDAAARQRFALRGMDLQRKYTVLIDDRLAATMTGKQLMEEGITVTVASRNGAQIAVVTPA